MTTKTYLITNYYSCIFIFMFLVCAYTYNFSHIYVKTVHKLLYTDYIYILYIYSIFYYIYYYLYTYLTNRWRKYFATVVGAYNLYITEIYIFLYNICENHDVLSFFVEAVGLSIRLEVEIISGLAHFPPKERRPIQF